MWSVRFRSSPAVANIEYFLNEFVANLEYFLDELDQSKFTDLLGHKVYGSRIAHITMEACTVNFLLFAQNLTSVPKSFDPDCLKLSFLEQNWESYHICPQNSEQFVTLR